MKTMLFGKTKKKVKGNLVKAIFLKVSESVNTQLFTSQTKQIVLDMNKGLALTMI
jgi:hypothetical protein